MIGGCVRCGDSAKVLLLMALVCLLVLAAIVSITQGAVQMPLRQVVGAIIDFDGSRDHLVIMTVRMPRVLAGLLAGAALGVAGAIMQALTGNPLASPDLLGINAGAAFAVVVALTFMHATSGAAYVWYAFSGAAAAAVLVHAFGSAGISGAVPLKLMLAGVALTAFLTSLTTAILIWNQGTLDTVRLWTAGSLSGRSMPQVAAIAPYILSGLAAALIMRRQFMTLSLGRETARSIGQSPLLWHGIAIVIVTLLAGGAVALAGPIGFVGLVVPHIVRFGIGVDYRWIIPFSALGGALLLVLADTAGRTLLAQQSFPVGVTMALIGGPFFIWLARRSAGGRS